MLEELLPISKIKEKIKNLQKNKDTNSENEVSVGGANLLFETSPEHPQSLKDIDLKSYYHSPLFVKLTQLSIIVLTVVFLLISLLNLYLNARINRQKRLLDETSSELVNLTDSLKDLDRIAKKVELLQEQKASTSDFSPYVELFLDSFDLLKFENFKLDTSKASFSATTSSPVSFSLAIERYLSSGLVENVILQTASLEKESNLYELNIEVNLK